MDERNSAAERASGRNERGRKQIPGLHSSAADVSGGRLCRAPRNCIKDRSYGKFYRRRQEGVGVFPIFIIGRYFGRFRSGNATKCRDRASIQKKILIANLLKPYDYEYEKDCLVDVCRLHGYIWMQFVYCG